MSKRCFGMKDDLPVVVYITQRLSKIRGKKALQKIVYFVKEFGVPMTYSFRWWFFGPFSKELYDDLDFLIADNVLSYDWTSHEITFRAKRRNYDSVGVPKEKIDELLKVLGGITDNFDPLKLELAASIHFLYNYAAGLDGKDFVSILNFLKKQKPKFREDQIKDMWNRLKSNNLLEKAR